MARRRAGLSQRELARRSGIPQPTVSRIERGRISPTMETLEPLIRACGMRLLIEDDPTRGVDRTMLREMLHLVDIGAVEPRELDAMVRTTLRAFVPVFGPLQMTDLIGHDTLRDISNALYPELAADTTASSTIERHVRDGSLGVKTKRGFYDDNDERVAELTTQLYRLARELGDSG